MPSHAPSTGGYLEEIEVVCYNVCDEVVCYNVCDEVVCYNVCGEVVCYNVCDEVVCFISLSKAKKMLLTLSYETRSAHITQH